MMVRFVALIAFTLMACSSTSSNKVGGAAKAAMLASKDSTAPDSEKAAPGTGVLCMAALLNVAVEVGKACYPADNPVGQQRLQSLLKQLDDYMLQDSEWSPERLSEFKKKQGGAGFSEHVSCEQLDADTKGFYTNFVNADPEKMKQGIDDLTAIPGKPSWGDCL